MEGKNIKLKHYLLGMLPDDETEAIDLSTIADEGFADELLLAEHDLAEDFQEGELSAEERSRFETHFLTSPERRRLLREVSIFKDIAARNGASGNEAKAPARRRGFFDLYFRPLVAAAAVIAVLGLGWYIFLRDARSPLETEYARLNKQDLGDPARLSDYSSIDLAPGTFRGEAAAAKHSASDLTDTVLFRLALMQATPEDARFKATVRHAGAPDFSIENVRVYRNQGGLELRMLVPKAVLQKGRYQIIVESTSGGQPAGNYNFTIE